MRASVASLSRKFISVFFAATLALGLVPAAAFAQPEDAAAAAESSESANADSDIQAEAEASAYGENQTVSSADVISSEGDEVPEAEKSRSSSEGEDVAQAGEDASSAVLPAGDIINQEMELDTVVAQAESTRSFFLAQTLESTRTVPVVSAKLPIDTGANDAADAVADEGDGEGQAENDGNGNGESGESTEGDDSEPAVPAVSAESTVIGAFEYLGMTFAIEPGGESVALMAVDYSKLPEECIQKQVLVIPDAATPDGVDYYSVTRIADDAFAGLNKDNANPDYVGCEALFSDEELLAEAGIDPSEVAEFLADDGAAVAAEESESAGADSDIAQKRKASAYEDQDQATAEPAEDDGAVPQVISGEVSLSDDPSQHVISSGVSEANGVEKSRPSDEDGGEASADPDDDVRTIVSMEGNVATLDDGSTYEFTNPLAGCAGILALGIPASVTTIEDDAFAGFSTLQYIVVSEDNQSYASYDGALYSADESQLRLIPEGRVGAVRVAPSATGVDPEVFSHCPSVDALVADAEGEVRDLLTADKNWLYLQNANDVPIRVFLFDDSEVFRSEGFGFGYRDVLALVGRSLSAVASKTIDQDRFSMETIDERRVSRAGVIGKFYFFGKGYGIGHGLGIDPSRDTCGDGSPIRMSGDAALAYPQNIDTIAQYFEQNSLSPVSDKRVTSGGWYASSPARSQHTTYSEWYYCSLSYGTHFLYDPVVGWFTWHIDSANYCTVMTDWSGLAYPQAQYEANLGVVYCAAVTKNSPDGPVVQEKEAIQPDVEYFWHPGASIFWNTNGGTWDGGSRDGTAETVMAAWSEAEEHSTSLTEQNGKFLPKIENKVCIGWSTDPNATEAEYTNDSVITVSQSNPSITLYAVYADGYKVAWDKTRFGSDKAQFTQFGENAADPQANNSHSATLNSVGAENDTEIAVIEKENDSDFGATTRFPQVRRADDDQGGTNRTRFLGWTTNEDGSAPSRKDASGNAKASAYFNWDDGVIKLDKDSFYLVKESAQDKLTSALAADDILEKYSISEFRNQTFYAVWETDVTFNAGSYGGLIANASDATDKGDESITVTVFNNRPIPAATGAGAYTSTTDPTATFVPKSDTAVGAADGNIVPNKYSYTSGYTLSSWRFMGWTTQANPNTVDGRNTPDSSGLECKSGTFTETDMSQALIPNGATTYYGVWECDVQWDAPDANKVTGPNNDGSGTITSSVNEGNEGWYLYGAKVNAPGTVEPSSHAFLRFEDPLKRAGKDLTSSTGELVVDTGGTWNVFWGPNIYKVVFKDVDGNDRAGDPDGTGLGVDLGSVYMEYGKGWYTGFDKDAGDNGAVTGTPLDAAGDGLAGGYITAPVRPGFICVGYARDPNAIVPEFFFAQTDGEYEFSASENKAPNDIFSNSSRGIGTDAATGLRTAYLYPVWRADVTWDYNDRTQSTASDNKVEVQTVYINNRTGVWADGQSLPQMGEAALPQVSVKNQGARAGYKPGVTEGEGDGARVIGWKLDYADGSLADTDTLLSDAGSNLTIAGSGTAIAQWTANEYEIEFDLGALDYDGQRIAYGGDTAGIVSNSLQQSIGTKAGDPITASVKYTVEHDGVTIPTFTKAGYQLKGWTVGDASDAGDDAQGLDAIKGAATDVTLDDGAVRKLLADNYAFATGSGGSATDPLHVRGNIKLTAVWGAAQPYWLSGKATAVYLDGQPVADPAKIAELYEMIAAGGAFDLPTQYYASGLPLKDPTTKPGYTFAGWKAYKGADPDRTTMLMRTGGMPIENLADGDAPVKQGADATALQIRPDTTGDNVVTLVAYFTADTYKLDLDLTLPDADKKGGTYAGDNWTAATGGAGKTFAYENDANPNGDKSGYSLYETSISIPAPARKGQTFDGWTLQVKQADGSYANASAEILVDVMGGTEKSDPCTFTVLQDRLADYRLVARWTESKYAISFSGLTHVNDAAAGEKTARFVEVSDGAGGANTFGAATFGFDGDTLTGGKTVTMRELTEGDGDYDTARYTGFLGWYLPAGTGNLGNLFIEDTDEDSPRKGRFYTTSLTVDQATLDDLFGTDAGEDGFVLELEAAFAPKADYAMTIDLNGGTYNMKQADGTYVEQKPATFEDKVLDGDGHATYKRFYSNESGDIALPDPMRYGYAFLGWTLAGTGLSPDSAGDVAKGWTVKGDSVGDRTYTARWQAAKDKVLLYNNLRSVYPEMADDASPTERELTYGEPMPTGFTKPTDPVNVSDPAKGYVFVGYFDTPATTGGKQYYTLNSAGAVVSARAWDKNAEFAEGGTTVIPHTLYARWEAVVPEGTADANKTQNAYNASAFVAAKVDGDPATTDSKTAFSASYNGRFTHEATDRITVQVNSYTFTDGMTAKGVYDAFNATRDESAAEKYLLGFVIESTGDVISFADIALGSAFEFAFKASDVADGSPAEPGFSLKSDGIYAIYSTTPFDFEAGEGGEPPSLDPAPGRSTVIALFDANGGAFEGGKTNDRTTTLYGTDAAAGQSTTVNLPNAPARKGYEFAGWAKTSAHVDGDHASSVADAMGTDMFGIIDITTKRYFAHWTVKGCDVKLRLNYEGAPADASIKVPYDSTAALDAYDGTAAFAKPAEREGYVFLGWFDDANTKLQYFTSTGAAARAWDYEQDPNGGPVYLTAHWLDLNAPGSGPQSDPADPVPGDPFPGENVDVTPTSDGKNQVRMPAAGAYAEGGNAAVALNGTYDGIFATPKPVTDAGDVAVTMYAYAPATVNDDVRHIISKYEASAPAGTYLQGFRVASTNSFISIADLYAGRPVTFYAKGSDLEGGTADRANLMFGSGAVAAEYGPTQQVPPESVEGDEWPDMSSAPTVPSPLPQVHNTFDARGGLFSDDPDDPAAGGMRFMTVDTEFGSLVRVPDAQPKLEDGTYHFDAWYYTDSRGDVKKLEVNESGVAKDLMASTVSPVTFYARYVRTYYDFTVKDAQDGVKDVHRTDGGAERTVGTFSPYEGETLTLMEGDLAGMADALGTRDGYDFIGYFYRAGSAGAYTYRPFYLTKQTENSYAWNYSQKMSYDVDFADLDDHASGWSTLDGIGSSSEDDPTKVTLYALWQPITYDIIWQYNWDGRELGSGKVEYLYKKDGARLDSEVTENVLFGDQIYDRIPVIENPAFVFEGWYNEKNTTGGTTNRVAFRRVRYNGGHADDTRSEYGMFSTTGSKRYFTDHGSTNDVTKLSFEPTGMGTLPVNADTGNRCFTFFAGFTGQSEGYKYRIYLSQTADNAHGQVDASLNPVTDAGGLAYLEYDYQPQYSYNLTAQYDSKIKAAPGYRKTGWFASPDATTRLDLDGDVTIPQWSSGLKEYYIGWDHNAYSIGLKLNTLDVGEKSEDGAAVLSTPQGALLLNPEQNDFPINLDMPESERTITMPNVTGAIGYEFKGWKRCDENGRLYVDDSLGTTFATLDPGASIEVDDEFIKDKWNFNGADSGTVYYGAVWEPYTYEVRFHERPVSAGAADEYDVCTLTSNTTADSSGSHFVLPYPHSTLTGEVFRFWSLEEQDPRDPSPCASWKSGTPLSLDEIFAVQKDSPGFAERFEGGKGIIDMWSQWNTIAASTVPLTVNVLIDPWSPDREDGTGKIITNADGYYVEGEDGPEWTADDGSGTPPDSVVANAWLGTDSESRVRIESLTFERGDDDVFATAVGDKADMFELWVYAGGRGEEAVPLKINLAGGADGRTVFLRDGTTGQSAQLGSDSGYLSDYAGFDSQIAKGSPLLIHYDLHWDDSLKDLSEFTTLVDPNKLLDASATSGSSLSRATLPIAKLYYTIGLVPLP